MWDAAATRRRRGWGYPPAMGYRLKPWVRVTLRVLTLPVALLHLLACLVGGRGGFESWLKCWFDD